MNALIFDLDGTLWDATDALTALWQQELRRVGITRPLTHERMSCGMGLGPEALAELLAPELPMAQRLPFFNHVTQAETKFIPQYGATLYPGMADTLRTLAGEYQIMIASNCVDGYIECFLDYAGLRGAVSDFAHPGMTGLPKAGNIRLLIERNGIDRAVMIGDTALDYEAAVGAGIPFLHAAYGFGAVPQAKFSFASITELASGTLIRQAMSLPQVRLDKTEIQL